MPHFPRVQPVAALVVALGLLAACGGDSEERVPSATIAGSSPTSKATTTTQGLEPPLLIDAAYLDRVMGEVDRRLRTAFEAAHEAGEIGTAFRDAARTFYTDAQAEKLVGDANRLGLPAFENPPGLPTTEVRDVLTARPDCVFFTAQRDLLPLIVTPYDQVQPYWLHLVPASGDKELPWRLDEDTFYADASTPPNPCG